MDAHPPRQRTQSACGLVCFGNECGVYTFPASYVGVHDCISYCVQNPSLHCPEFMRAHYEFCLCHSYCGELSYLTKPDSHTELEPGFTFTRL